MPNLRIFGSPIHDTALVIIVISSIVSSLFYFTNGEVDQMGANISLIGGIISGFLYWFTQYKIKK